jgi:hypothetical protein
MRRAPPNAKGALPAKRRAPCKPTFRQKREDCPRSIGEPGADTQCLRLRFLQRRGVAPGVAALVSVLCFGEGRT